MRTTDGVTDLDDVRERLIKFALPPKSEELDLAQSRGRILDQAIRSDRDLPPFDRATMDGIAIRASESGPGARFRITGSIAAGDAPGAAPPPGSAVRIATGAPVPEGLDAVVQRELVTEVPDPGNDLVQISADDVDPWNSIHRRGCDASAGDQLVPAERRIDAATIGIAATTGRSLLKVRVRPRCAILTTGDELREVDDPLDQVDDRYRIRDGNGPMLAAALQDLGAEVVSVARAGDELEDTRRSIAEALDQADICITVGGVSAGDLDFVPRAASDLELEEDGRGVAVQPGRPFAWWKREGALRLLGLPGNPVSALVCTHLFIRAWLESSLGIDPRAAWTPRRLLASVKPNPRRVACRPSRFSLDDQGRAGVTVATWNGSGDLAHLIGTQGIARLPRQEEILEVGTIVPTLSWATTTTMNRNPEISS
ncbi:MAG: molybdopterin molybdenumtransferase MoeA [Planctomycetaceae bacterium]|nr:molybdopterin molybdenumtransferase MoeA [Planctomycetaceae bacterium]